MQSEIKGKLFFTFAIIVLFMTIAFAATIYNKGWHNDVLYCSTRAIMHFENNVTESVNVNLHFSFYGKGKGSLIVEGYSDSSEGKLYLQRYVNFDYVSHLISATQREYRISHWRAQKSSIDQSPDLIFDYFMREMSDSHDGLLLSMAKVNNTTVLLSSIHSPLFLCSLKSGSHID